MTYDTICHLKYCFYIFSWHIDDHFVLSMCIAFFISINIKLIWFCYTYLDFRRGGDFNCKSFLKLWNRMSVDRCWLGVDRHLIIIFILLTRIRINSFHESWVITHFNVGGVLLVQSNMVIENILIYECQAQFIRFHVANSTYSSHEGSPK